MGTLDGVLLSDRQISLLDELAAAVGSGSGGASSSSRKVTGPSSTGVAAESKEDEAAYEAFHRHWQLVRSRHRCREGSKRRGRWQWINQVQEICESACGELDALLSHLSELDSQRCEVLRKTTTLHEQCEQMVQDQERLGAEAEALAERLDLFDRVADVARVLDHQAANLAGGAASASSTSGSQDNASDFKMVLDQIDSSIAFLEAHPDFCQSQAYIHQFEHLRNRACLSIRSALQRCLEKSLAQVEQQLKDGTAQGAVDTQVFYTRFRAIAANYRPLMQLLHQRLDAHETYLVLLEELEGFYVHLRLKLLTLPVSAHLQSTLHKDLEMSQLAPATRQASSYILEISLLEKQCFEAYFEMRQPQEALRTLLETVAEIFYKTLRPLVLACDSIDSLREIADCLQMDVLEPNRQRGKSDLVPVLAVISRLHKDVQEKLIYRVELYIREDIRGYSFSGSDLNYPSVLLGETSSAEEEVAAAGFQQGLFPTLPRTLAILAKIYRVLEMSTFQGLAQEAVDLCIASLKQASAMLARRALPRVDSSLQALSPLCQMMDSQLFLVKHLLLLREQVAAFECDLVVSEKYFNFANVWEALNLKLPDGILGILKPTVVRSEVDSKKDIEAELKSACEALITNLTANITQPLVALNTKIGAYLATSGVDRATLKEQPFMKPEELQDIIGAFLANVRGRVPFAAAHIRVYLSASRAGSAMGTDAGDTARSSASSTAPILFKPVEIRLVDTWGRLEGLLEEQAFSNSELETLGFIRPEALRELVTSLFNSVMEAPWESIVQTVSQVPRAASQLSAARDTTPASGSASGGRSPGPESPVIASPEVVQEQLDQALSSAAPPPPPPPPPPEPASPPVAA